jgi:hypothetical protein
LTGGTANGVVYLDTTKALTTGSALVFNGTNFGIGAASPSKLLTIGSTTTVNPTVRMNGSSTAGSDTYQYSFGLDDTGDFAGIKLNYADRVSKGLQIFTAPGYSFPITFYTNSATQAMTLDVSGNLLVGTTSQISSGKQVVSFNGVTFNGLVLSESANTSNSTYIAFNNGASVIGSVSRVGATAAVIYNTASDERLKSNIQDAAPVLNKIMQVQVRQYDWTEGDLHQEYGFIAQELQPVLSGVVTKGKTEEDVWQLDYSRLTPHLLKAIQEQQVLITTLTARITALEGA